MKFGDSDQCQAALCAEPANDGSEFDVLIHDLGDLCAWAEQIGVALEGSVEKLVGPIKRDTGDTNGIPKPDHECALSSLRIGEQGIRSMLKYINEQVQHLANHV
jgi:hypothetical protein